MTLSKVPNPGLSGGMNISVPPEFIEPEQAHYAIDCLFNEPGVVKRRGAMQNSDVLLSLISPYVPIKAFTTQRTDGTTFIGLVCVDPVTNFVYFVTCDQNFGNLKTEQISNSVGANLGALTSVKPALGGGVWVGVSNTAEASALPSTNGRQFSWLWKGASFVSAGFTLSATPVALNALTVTLASTPTPNLVGGFIFNSSGFLVGTVKSVAGAVITLDKPATATATASSTMNIRPVRGWMNFYSKGRITTSTANAIVAGAGTDFTNVNNGAWVIYRSSDNAYVGTVSSSQNSTALTLAANAGVNMANESYWAIASQQVLTTTTPTAIDPHLEIGLLPNWGGVGWINAQHQGRQWFANRNLLPDAGGDFVSRLWVSDTQFGESIDMSITDGDYLHVGTGSVSTGPILEIVSMQNQLLVFKESEVWAVVGDEPSNYTSQKFFSDGLLCTMGWATWNDGIIWIGRRGLWYYDGVSAPVNLVKDTMGQKWIDFVSSFSQANFDRCWLAVLKDHAMVSISNYNNQIAPNADLQTPMPVVYVPTQALSFWSNMQHQGGFNMGGVLSAHDIIVAATNPNLTNVGGIIDMANVFSSSPSGTVDAKLLGFASLATTVNVAASPGGTLPLSTIKVNGVSSQWTVGAGHFYVNGDPMNKVSYAGYTQAGGVTTFTGCTGGVVGTVITPTTTVISSQPLGPYFLVTSRNEGAGDITLRKSFRQVSFSYLASNGTLNFYTSVAPEISGIAPRLNPIVANSFGVWTHNRQRFGHVGFVLNWTIQQTNNAGSDFRLGSSDIFWKPQRARRVK